jgi:spore coat polysaccharide biosynthesis protein SpsF
MGSERLPGKMLEPLSGQPILEWVLARLKNATLLDHIVLATTTDERDDPLAKIASDDGVEVFRGDEQDVLGRFVAAAEKTEAKTIVRVCADNPLVAPEAVDLAVNSFITQKPDYAFNHIPKMGNKYPDGVGVEVLDVQLLNKLGLEITDASLREHVTLGIWNNTKAFDILHVECPEEWRDIEGDIKLDVDTPEDLAKMKKLCRGLSIEATVPEIISRWQEMKIIPANGQPQN